MGDAVKSRVLSSQDLAQIKAELVKSKLENRRSRASDGTPIAYSTIIIIIIICMYSLINEQECFIGFNLSAFKTTRRSRVVLDPILKHDVRVY